MNDIPDPPRLTHLDATGQLRMVDVSSKEVTVREATASARLTARSEVIEAIAGGKLPKGDAIAAARLAGVMAAKRTSEWIPLCHALPLEWAEISIDVESPGTILIRCTTRVCARTGVEMEALVGASAAALTLYDMAKAADRAIVIGPIQLESKSGGRSGEYRRSRNVGPA